MSLYSGLGGGGGPSAHSDILSANPTNPSSQTALIEEIKRRGRACVVSKNYPDADSLYGKGIEVLSSILEDGSRDDDTKSGNKKDIAIFYSNRSLVRMQMDKIAEALEDADSAVGHDPSYVKAHWRRGQASNAGGNTAEALTSFERALALDPTNKALKKEVQNAKEKKEREEKMLKEAEEAAAAAAAAADAEDGENAADDDVAMQDAPKKNATTTTITKSAAGNGKTTTSKGASTVKETDGSVFTKSDHVRGYKIRSDGKKTSYFDREISDDAKKLIGDIAPKKLDDNGGGGMDCSPKPIGAAEGTSAWNKAGTWEERDVTPWATETLTASLLAAEYVLPPGSPSPGARATVSEVSKFDGHASHASVRGKKKYIYEFALQIKWELALGDDKTCRGEITFPDVDGTIELGEGYDIVKYAVDPSTPAGTGPLLERFVRDGGLRDSLHKAIDDWVRLFRATY